MDLIAKLPCVAAKIYRNLYREGSSIGAIDPNLDWSHNFTNMLGYTDPQFIELMRLYLTIHRYRRAAGEGAGGDLALPWGKGWGKVLGCARSAPGWHWVHGAEPWGRAVLGWERGGGGVVGPPPPREKCCGGFPLVWGPSVGAWET